MKFFALLIAVLLSIPVLSRQADAAPKTRYDEASQTCRVLEDGPLEWESRPWGEGSRLFKENCRNCHSRKNDKSAPFLWTESKSSAAWNRVFASRSPQCAIQGAWNGLSPEQLRKVNDYLYRWAANSQDKNDSC